MNRGDTEIAIAMIEGEHEISSLKSSEVVVINSCAVIQFTERKVLKRISYLKNLGKKVVLTGCLPFINFQAALESKADSIASLGNIKEAIDSASRYVNLSSSIPKSCVPKKRQYKTIAIVPISEGCLGNCTYCATKNARGKLRSFPIDSILKEVKECVSAGYKEIRLTAQDTGCYGIDTGARLPTLLEEICKIPGDFRIRVGMMNPNHIKKIKKDLIEVFSNEKIYKFAHIPVQSGDDSVLKDMKRGYSSSEFISLIKEFRKIGEITISTDVIVGYPTESYESFIKTYKMIEKVKPDILNITRYSPRSNTPAARLKDQLERIKKERSRMMTKLHKRISKEINKKFIGRELKVLVLEEGKKGKLLGRTDSYKLVVLPDGEIGEFAHVKIKDATPTYLLGEIL
jgi:MiaB-like tRNA modifying enzyme